MVKDRIFTTALFISLGVHTVFLFNLPLTNRVFLKNVRPYNKLEVTYYNIKEPAKLLSAISPKNLPIDPVDNFNKKFGLPSKKQTASKKEPILEQKKKIESTSVIRETFNVPKAVVTDLKSDLKNKAGYDNYYRIVREKIRRAALLNRPADFQEGSTYLAFSVKKDGSLEGLKIISSKTIASAILKEAALKSVRDASPFPPLPNELNQDSIHFSVIISFVLDK